MLPSGLTFHVIFLFLYRAYNATIVVKETVTIANMIGSEIALVVGLIIDTNVDATAFLSLPLPLVKPLLILMTREFQQFL